MILRGVINVSGKRRFLGGKADDVQQNGECRARSVAAESLAYRSEIDVAAGRADRHREARQHIYECNQHQREKQ